MLRECERFRSEHSPERPEQGLAHRQTCSACRRWASELEASIAAVRGSGEPLPENLRRALVAVPREADGCPAGAELAAAVFAPEGPAVAEHMRACPRCRAVGSVLLAVADRSEAPLTPGLRHRLLALATPGPRVSGWLRWGDLGSLAASFVLTVALTLAAGDSAATLFRETPLPVTELSWIDEGRQQVREGWSAFVDGLGSGWTAWSDRFQRMATAWAGRLDPAGLEAFLPTIEITPAVFDNDTPTAEDASADPGDPDDPSHD